MAKVESNKASKEVQKFQDVDNETLLSMHESAKNVLYWQSILAKKNDSVITEFLRGVSEVKTDQFYPEDTVEDEETGCQFYFHAHSDRPEEYGHFHTYVMEAGLPKDIIAVAPSTFGEPSDPDRTHCHIIAIGIKKDGTIDSLFTLNHWSSQEAKYALEDLEKILDCFDITHAHPSYPVNRWISSFIKMYKLEILELYKQRETLLYALQTSEPDITAMANENVDVTSKVSISIEAYALEIQQEVIRRSN